MRSTVPLILAAVALLCAPPATAVRAQSAAGPDAVPPLVPVPAAGAAGGEAAPAPASPAAKPRFRSAEDGWLDVSGFLDQVYGFVPVVIPITEPAVGYGAGGALLFIDKPVGEARQAGFGRPNLTAVGGFGTENGSRGWAAGDVRQWLDDRLQTLVGGVDASVNLDFYGIGEGALSDQPRSYTLEPLAALVQAKYRIGDSRVWAGLAYAYADVQVRFDAPEEVPDQPDPEEEVRVGGLAPLLAYDSRDNIFTPTSGTYLEAAPGFFAPAFGGDDEFRRAALTAMHYLPLRPRLTLGLRGVGTFSSGDVPFFLRPFVMLRGAPVMRYQGEQAASVEAEVRWRCWKRFSLVGFAGAGAAWNDFERVDDTLGVVTGGVGFRYELARAYGLHAGLDLAFGPDATAIYVVVGSAWMRP